MKRWLVFSIVFIAAGLYMLYERDIEYCALCWAVAAQCHSIYTLERVKKLDGKE